LPKPFTATSQVNSITPTFGFAENLGFPERARHNLLRKGVKELSTSSLQNVTRLKTHCEKGGSDDEAVRMGRFVWFDFGECIRSSTEEALSDRRSSEERRF